MERCRGLGRGRVGGAEEIVRLFRQFALVSADGESRQLRAEVNNGHLSSAPGEVIVDADSSAVVLNGTRPHRRWLQGIPLPSPSSFAQTAETAAPDDRFCGVNCACSIALRHARVHGCVVASISDKSLLAP